MTSATSTLNAFIDSNQNIYAFGNNGAYYAKDQTEFKKPTLMDNQKWKKVSIGTNFIAAIREDDTLWVKGLNANGKLGINSGATNQAFPSWNQVGKDRKWKDVSCGDIHMIAIDENGFLWGAGTNVVGSANNSGLIQSQIGLLLNNKNIVTYAELTLLGSSYRFKNVYCASNRTYLINTANQLLAFGCYRTVYNSAVTYFLDSSASTYGDVYNSYYNRTCMAIGVQRISGTFSDIPIKVEGGYCFAYFLSDKGDLYGQGTNKFGELEFTYSELFVKEKSGKKWKDFSCGFYHIVAIDRDGKLWARGFNTYGQLGDGTTNSRNTWVKISDEQWMNVNCGMYHTTAIKEDGTVWTFGSGSNYVLGRGDSTANTVKPINITPSDIDVYKCAENFVTKKYIVNQKAVFKFTVEPIKKLYSIIPKGTFPANTHFLMQFSDDGSIWKTYDEVNEEWIIAQSNDEGITPTQINSIVDDKLSWLSDKQFYIKGIMWTENEDVSAILKGFDAKLYMNLNSPQVTNLNITAIKAEKEKAKFSATRSNATNAQYEEIEEDEVSDVSKSSSGNYVKLKADLKQGQTIDAISYSYN